MSGCRNEGRYPEAPQVKGSLQTLAAVLLVAGSVTGCGSGSGTGVSGRRASSAARTTVSSTKPYALWIGDSYTAGAGATSSATGEALMTTRVLGWLPALDAEGGTGFVANGHANSLTYEPVPDRLRHDKRKFSPPPAVVVIDAGRNDVAYPEGRVRRAVVSYFRALARAFPKSAIVVIAPFVMRSKPTDYRGLRCLLDSEADLHDWAFVDPLGEGWINKKSAKLVVGDGVHPNQEGYDYIVKHLAPAIRTALATAHERVKGDPAAGSPSSSRHSTRALPGGCR